MSADVGLLEAEVNLEEANKPTSKTAINQGRAVRGIGFLYDLPLILVNLGGSGLNSSAFPMSHSKGDRKPDRVLRIPFQVAGGSLGWQVAGLPGSCT